MRKLLISLASLVFILVAAAFIGPWIVPADSIKSDIAREVAKATGRDLSIDGKLKFRILPAPGVSARDLRLSNVSGGSAPDMLRLKSAVIEVAPLPLIMGDIQVSRVVLSEPDILLEQYADGTNNWNFVPSLNAEPIAGANENAPAGDNRANTPPVRLDDIVIERGTLVFRTSGNVELIEDINVSLGAGSMTGPFRANGTVNAHGFSVKLNATVGEFVADKATPINLRISAGGAEFGYSGALAGAPNAPRMSGHLEVRARDISTLASVFTKRAVPLKGKALELDGTLTASAEAVSVENLDLRLGDDYATGAIDITFGEIPSAAVIINVAQLDLDRLLMGTPSETSALALDAIGNGRAKEQKSADGSASDSGVASTLFTLPTGISATLETKIDSIVYRGGVIRKVQLNTELAGGSLTISNANAQLPGGANASLLGFVTTADAMPKFEGQAELSANNLRTLLQWADVDVAAVPQDRLRKMEGAVSIVATPENLTLTNIEATLDESRLRGGVAIAIRERPGFGIGLSIDKVNVDAYLPESPPVPGGTNGSPDDNVAPSASVAGQPSSSGAFGLAALDGFDAVLQLKIGEVALRNQRLSGINIGGTLQGGALELRDTSVTSLAGAKAMVRGRIERLANNPTADITIHIDARNGDRLMALAGIDASASLGPTKLDGSLRGDIQDLDVDITLNAMGARLRTTGNLGLVTSLLRYDVEVTVDHPNAAAFVARMRGKDAASVSQFGAFSARTILRGDLSVSDIDAMIDIGAGSVGAKGKLTNLSSAAPRGNLKLEAEYPDILDFTRLFAPEYRPSRPDLGKFVLKAELFLRPGGISISELRGNAGPVGFAGSATVNSGGPRSNIVAALETDEIIVDWFLPASGSTTPKPISGNSRPSEPSAQAASGVGSSPGTARWSREPIELSALRAADADIQLSAPAITFTNIRVDAPRLAVRLNDGVLDLTELSGQVFGGGFDMTGQIVAGDLPAMRYAMKVDNADAAKFLAGGRTEERGVMSVLDLLFPVSDVTLESGRLGAELDVTSRGRSEFEMVSNLAGKGSMRFTNAVVQGIDVCAISDQLNRLNGIESFLGLTQAGRGGRTKVANFDGEFDLDKGIATLPQQQIKADCAAAVFRGTTNLPAWEVNIRARADFPAHPEFAGLEIEQKGSIDAANTRLVNLNEINRFIVGKAAGSVLRKLFPGGNRDQQPLGGEGNLDQQPPQSRKPEEQFRNLLEGLIRGR